MYWLALLKNPLTPVKLSHEHKDYKWLTLEPAKIVAEFDDMKQLLEESQKFIQETQNSV